MMESEVLPLDALTELSMGFPELVAFPYLTGASKTASSGLRDISTSQ